MSITLAYSFSYSCAFLACDHNVANRPAAPAISLLASFPITPLFLRAWHNRQVQIFLRLFRHLLPRGFENGRSPPLPYLCNRTARGCLPALSSAAKHSQFAQKLPGSFASMSLYLLARTCGSSSRSFSWPHRISAARIRHPIGRPSRCIPAPVCRGSRTFCKSPLALFRSDWICSFVAAASVAVIVPV